MCSPLKKISPYCLFKNNQRLAKNSILNFKVFSLTLQCDAHRRAQLFGMMHTAELDSTEWCTLRSLTPRYDAHRWAPLRGGMHTGEFFEEVGTLDSTVWCTLRRASLRGMMHTAQSLTPRNAHRRVSLIRKCPFFVFSYLLRLSTLFYQKTS